MFNGGLVGECLNETYTVWIWCLYIQCPPLILAPLVNMSKGDC